jgi:hypothetical protein
MYEYNIIGAQGALVFRCAKQNERVHRISLDYPNINAFDASGWSWTATELGVHSRSPLFTGQESYGSEPCGYLDREQQCYYDTTYLGATEFLNEWMRYGQDPRVLRRMMESRYFNILVEHADDNVFMSPLTLLLHMLTQEDTDEARWTPDLLEEQS